MVDSCNYCGFEYVGTHTCGEQLKVALARTPVVRLGGTVVTSGTAIYECRDCKQRHSSDLASIPSGWEISYVNGVRCSKCKNAKTDEAYVGRRGGKTEVLGIAMNAAKKDEPLLVSVGGPRDVYNSGVKPAAHDMKAGEEIYIDYGNNRRARAIVERIDHNQCHGDGWVSKVTLHLLEQVQPVRPSDSELAKEKSEIEKLRGENAGFRRGLADSHREVERLEEENRVLCRQLERGAQAVLKADGEPTRERLIAQRDAAEKHVEILREREKHWENELSRVKRERDSARASSKAMVSGTQAEFDRWWQNNAPAGAPNPFDTIKELRAANEKLFIKNGGIDQNKLKDEITKLRAQIASGNGPDVGWDPE